ncbi:YbhB/YbcL family Raf kinase inhibitor-like protein [Gleimia hominis]|uniref:YbhB/YbcL family Raf kinase inhibitor-like protein n=1 Tax=Gleimia hominis TaxID=595468 RepID=UPI000C80E090|nr:YbhB/YbcL family Raf kinase inhibitor-like protein [Gleimia hominis]WIK64983.1 YbhB/YbcL family Raf kinase inhibitor-like protein [Gleimia hominis]
MDLNARPQAPHPDEALPPVPTFTLTSTSGEDGAVMPPSMTAAGGSNSPQLKWSGFPAETESFVVTCFDPDAPTLSGFWHWAIVDLPASITELPEGAGESDLTLDGPAFHIRGDSGEASYYGAAPPQGDRPHRYVFTVYALDTPSLELDDDVTATVVSFNALFHTLARASLTFTFQQK